MALPWLRTPRGGGFAAPRWEPKREKSSFAPVGTKTISVLYFGIASSVKRRPSRAADHGAALFLPSLPSTFLSSLHGLPLT